MMLIINVAKKDQKKALKTADIWKNLKKFAQNNPDIFIKFLKGSND